jgi:hypothetical protein
MFDRYDLRDDDPRDRGGSSERSRDRVTAAGAPAGATTMGACSDAT